MNSADFLQVIKPEANTENRIKVAGNGLVFGFDAEQAMFERVEGDLVLTFEDGATLVLEDFFVADSSEALPVMSFASGEAVSGADFLASLDIDVMPAAGPQSSVQSSGGGDFGYNPGTMIDGLGRLDGLDVSFNTSSFVTEELGATGAGGSLVPGLGDDGGLSGPDGPTGPAFFYSARAVLYMHEYANGDDGASGNAVTLPFMFKDPQGQTSVLDASQIGSVTINGGQAFAGSGTFDVHIGLPEGWESSWLALEFNPLTGRLEITLTAEGLAALKGLDNGQDLLDYLAVSVTDASGNDYSYNVQIVASPDESYDSHARDQQDDHGRLEHGEYHSGQGAGEEAYTIRGSKYNDEISIDQTLSGATVYASQHDGQNTGADDFNTLNLTQGMVATQGRDNLVDSTDGVITVLSGNNENAIHADGGTNTLQGGRSDVNIHAEAGGNARGVLAQNGGSNAIAGGTIDISATGADAVGVFAQGGSNTIASGGTVTVEAHADSNWATAVSASDGSNTITAEGDLRFSATGENGANATGIASIGNSTNTILSRNGDIEINAAASGNNAWAMGIQAAGQDSANIITAQNGDITVTANGDGGVFSQGVRSEGYASNGQNVLSASGNITISALNAAENNTGVSAHGNGSLGGALNNALNAGQDLTVTASGTSSDPATWQQGSTSIGVWAGHDGGRNELAAGRDIELTARNAETVYGLYADRTLDGNTITAERDITITAENGKTATGIYAADAQNGNEISAGGTVSISVTGGDGTIDVSHLSASRQAEEKATYGVRAKDSTNGNTVTAGEGIDITASGQGEYTYGVAAQRSTGGNTLVAEAGDITIDVSSSTGYTRGISATNSIGNGEVYGNAVHAKDGNVDISAHSPLNAHGMEAVESTNGNLVTASGDVRIEASADATHSAAAMYAFYSDNGNVIEAGGDIELRANAGYSVSVVDSVGSNKGNTITAGGNVTIAGTGMNQAGDIMQGVYASGGSNTEAEYGNKIVSQNGDISVTLRDVASQAMGVWGNQGTNILDAENGSVTVDVQSGGFAAAVNASGGHNIINAGQDITLRAVSHGASDVQGLNASGQGSNTLTAGGDISIHAEASIGNAHAISASNSSTVLDAGGDIVIDAESRNGSAYGIQVSGASTSVNAEDNITVTATAAGNKSIAAYGVSADNLTMQAGRDITILSSASNDGNTVQARGLVVSDASVQAGSKLTVEAAASGSGGTKTAEAIRSAGGTNVIAAHDVAVTASADGGTANNAYGVINQTGSTTIEATRDMDLMTTAATLGTSGFNQAYGVIGHGGSTVLSAGGTITIDTSATGGTSNTATGVNSSGGSIAMTAAGVNITTSASGGQSGNVASGVLASGGDIDITANAVTVDTQASGTRSEAYAVKAEASSTNTISGDQVDISATSDGAAYALHATSGGSNLIKAESDQGVSVTITAKAGAAASAFAMYAQNAGNTIQTGAGNDTVVINGDMHAEKNGRNTISTGDGDDRVYVNGQMTSDATGQNVIDLGNGNNWLFLNGAISGNVSVTSGDGYDTIVLTAATFRDFMALYGDFLNTLLNGQHSIDAIATQGMDPAEMDQLAAWLGEHGFAGDFGSYNEATDSVDPYEAPLADAALAAVDLDNLDGADSDIETLASIVDEAGNEDGLVFQGIEPMQLSVETPDLLADVSSDAELVSTVAEVNAGTAAPQVDSMLSEYFHQNTAPTQADQLEQNGQQAVVPADLPVTPVQEIVDAPQQASVADDDAIAVQQAILNTSN